MPGLYHPRPSIFEAKGGGPNRGLHLRSTPLLVGLEEPLCAHIAREIFHGGYGDVHIVIRGVDDVPVAVGYTDVGRCAAAVLAEEDQVTGLGRPYDRRAHGPLSGWRVWQRNAELRVDRRRKGGAVYPGA